MNTPYEYYKQQLEAGYIKVDEDQARTIDYFQRLYDDLIKRQQQKPGLLKTLLGYRPEPLQGLYIWGGTGRGKTWLMDVFYRCLPFEEKYRVHFHRFMLDIHEQLKLLPRSPDPLVIIAEKLASKYRVICLDEFHVHDIADAMLMAGLLEAIFSKGLTLVATSNIAIDDLYKNGLQRDRFMYAIELLKMHTLEIDLGSHHDYRFDQLGNNEYYTVCTTGSGHDVLSTRFDQLAVIEPKHSRSLLINHRQIKYIALAEDLAWFDFRDLCATPRSANDYIEIAQLCHTVFISDIHVMTSAHDDVAKRFIHLVDALYDHRVKLIVTAEVEAGELYQGQRLAFAFERTISRLTEMGTSRYLSQAHQ